MAKGGRTKGRAKGKGKGRLSAGTADPHDLYQRTVQDTAFEVQLIRKLFRRRVGRPARSLREDFCGTALLCADWVRSHPERTALGVDIDPKVLRWGEEHNVAPLGEDRHRVTLRRADVRAPSDDRSDVLVAFNYSYFCFRDRPSLRAYFEAARGHLRDDGLLLLDLFGGWEAQQVIEEERKYRGYRYVWHQAAFNPIDHHLEAHIHFRFADGTELRNAFTYKWRLWTLPEVQELLLEAGFPHVEVLWEDEDEDLEGTGTFRPRTKVRNDPGFNAYLLASASPLRSTKRRGRRAP
ncbi:MAG: class I SAM-dependent methyltransferase [Sandaracinaceae bacterium]